VVDAVRLTARVFRQPSAEGYRETRDCSAAERIVPLFAPDAFALRLADLRRKQRL
jgi:hypothetical protein